MYCELITESGNKLYFNIIEKEPLSDCAGYTIKSEYYISPIKSIFEFKDYAYFIISQNEYSNLKILSKEDFDKYIKDECVLILKELAEYDKKMNSPYVLKPKYKNAIATVKKLKLNGDTSVMDWVRSLIR